MARGGGDELGGDGPLAAHLTGFERREGQQQMAHAVDATLRRGGRLMVEAGTGTGKTFAYLRPAMRWASSPNRRVVISTWTRHLQEQILERDLPVLREAFQWQGIATLVQGRENYVCRRRTEDALSREDVQGGPPARYDELRAIGAWAAQSASGRRSDLGFVPRADSWQLARAERGRCLGPKSPHFDACRWQSIKREARQASLLVVNHALLLADLVARRHGASVLPDYRAVIVDEAHHLEGVAADHLGVRLGRAGLFGALRRLEAWWSRIEDPGSLIERVARIREDATELFDQMELWLGGRRTRRFLEPWPGVTDVPERLITLGDALEAARLVERGPLVASRRVELDAEADRFVEWAIGLRGGLAAADPDETSWIEQTEEMGVTLRTAPRQPGRVLQQELFDVVHASVLTSATLRTPSVSDDDDDFEYLRDTTGCADADGLTVESPFDFARQVRVVIDWMAEPSDAEAYERELISRITAHVSASEGRAFVLFTSRRTMLAVADEVRARLADRGIDTLVQGREVSRTDLLDRFRTQQPAALLGLASFWEGVDVPGDALSHVVLTRLPFAVPDHPLEEARAERLRGEGRDPFREHSVPQAVLRWKQGFGRLIRSRSDRGVVTVLDRRVLTRPYGRLFLEALPECPRVLLRDGVEIPLQDDLA